MKILLLTLLLLPISLFSQTYKLKDVAHYTTEEHTQEELYLTDVYITITPKKIFFTSQKSPYNDSYNIISNNTLMDDSKKYVGVNEIYGDTLFFYINVGEKYFGTHSETLNLSVDYELN